MLSHTGILFVAWFAPPRVKEQCCYSTWELATRASIRAILSTCDLTEFRWLHDVGAYGSPS